MKSLPLAARVYVAIVIALGGILLGAAIVTAPLASPARFLILLALSMLASVLKICVPLPRALTETLSDNALAMSMSVTVNLAALFSLGVAEATLIAAAGTWAQCTFNTKGKNPLYRTLFNIGALVLTFQLTGWVYTELGGVPNVWTWPDSLAAVMGAAITHFLTNSLLVATAIAWSARQRMPRVWADNFIFGWVSHILGALMAAAAAAGIDRTGYWLVPMTVGVLYLTWRTYRMYVDRIEGEQRAVRRLSDLHLATIEALALAIDAKDRNSRTHLRRLQVYSVALARAEGLDEDDVQAIKTAALLHDIGMLAVPQHILAKAGRLSDEDLRKLRLHPEVGADIIRDVPFPAPVAPLIRAHHERWDGTGYPGGLRGKTIPIGARILATVDHLDAIMSEQADLDGEAIADRLREESGRALEPRLVSLVLEMLPALLREERQAREVDLEMPSLTSVAQRAPLPASVSMAMPSTPLPLPALGSAFGAAAGANGAASSSMSIGHGLGSHGLGSHGVGSHSIGSHASPTSALDHIALAHREIFGLYELSQAMSASLGISDTMHKLTARLSDFVPYSACALFLRDADQPRVRCRFAAGPAAMLVESVACDSGYGLAGRVVQQEICILNDVPILGVDFLEADAKKPLMSMSMTPVLLRSALLVPLRAEGACFGALAVYHEAAAFYSPDHRRKLEQVAEHAAPAIQNSIRFERTHEAAQTDRLTGLANSRALAAAFDLSLNRAVAERDSLSLLMIDLDHFKSINDTYGHEVGDRALKEVARFLTQSIRAHDFCARYAGDEFVLLLAACGPAEAERRARDLQTIFDAVRFAPAAGELVPLHVSIGAASFPVDGVSLEAMLAAADRRMYRDKAARKRAALRLISRDTPPIRRTAGGSGG
jgi:diguanylate cyclase (GGDEF)-like protein